MPRTLNAPRAPALLSAMVLLLVAGPLMAGTAKAATSTPVCDGSQGYSAAFEGRRTFLWRPDRLRSVKSASRADPEAPALTALIARADAALSGPVYTVVDKSQTPASGDRHDYMSMGPYWWPDPEQRDGLPYVRRDGEVNPERGTDAFDLADLDAMSRDVQSLSLAWYLTDDERYAARAAALIRAWFLAPETRMNPNFNHGQAVPGRVPGRAEGVIDAHRLSRVIESLGLLDTSTALSGPERLAVRAWFAALVDWMETSPIGLEEKAATNNHGIYYDMLISHFALYAGLDEVARTIGGRFGADRIASQFAPDGSLPQELMRTRSLHYTTWTMIAAFDLADLGRCVGVDLWEFRTDDDRSLQASTRFVARWAGREDEWPWPERDRTRTAGLYEVLRRGAWAWSDPALEAGAALYDARHTELELNLRLPAYRP